MISIIPSFWLNKHVAPAAPTSPVFGSTAIMENVSCENDWRENNSRKVKNKDSDKIKDNEIILDIGPKTISSIKRKIEKTRLI